MDLTSVTFWFSSDSYTHQHISCHCYKVPSTCNIILQSSRSQSISTNMQHYTGVWTSISIHRTLGSHTKQGPIPLRIYPLSLKFMDHLFTMVKVFTIKFCTWHDSCAIMSCAKMCMGVLTRKWVKDNFHTKFIYSRKNICETGPCQSSQGSIIHKMHLILLCFILI